VELKFKTILKTLAATLKKNAIKKTDSVVKKNDE